MESYTPYGYSSQWVGPKHFPYVNIPKTNYTAYVPWNRKIKKKQCIKDIDQPILAPLPKQTRHCTYCDQNNRIIVKNDTFSPDFN
jgi:hypothetical protein